MKRGVSNTSDIKINIFQIPRPLLFLMVQLIPSTTVSNGPQYDLMCDLFLEIRTR